MILDEILVKVRQRLQERKAKVSLEWYQNHIFSLPKVNGFKEALSRPGIQIIAEIKKASPSAGIIEADFDPVAIAQQYEAAGVAAISVLTEEDFFRGSIDILRTVQQVVTTPLLRKDFIVDPYQVYEARYYGASCILLIASILSLSEMIELRQIAQKLGLDALVEIHNEDELLKALAIKADIIGINNRNLKNFTVDLTTSLRLRKKIPAEVIVVSESGIKNRKDVQQLENAGIDAMLIGETLMRAQDKNRCIRELLGE